MRPETSFLNAFRAATSGVQSTTADSAAQIVGTGQLPSAFAVTDFAAASIANAGLSSLRLAQLLGGPLGPVVVDRRLASIWFGTTVRPLGWELPAQWDSIAGNYLAQGRFVRLHTNAPHHRQAALDVLGLDAASERCDVVDAVSGWDAFALHEELVAAGGVGAALRSRDEWAAHPQGVALATEPLVHTAVFAAPDPHGSMRATPDRPLAGVRVLDLTRVLAGPVATRFLAGLGADVLRIDPVDWNEPGTVPEVNLGKRCARLDLRSEPGRERFVELLASADILVHGYRLGALDGLGFDAPVRRSLNAALVDVSLNAYGHSGPWAPRRGFDSVVQVAAGIADAGMATFGTDVPKPLPVQALDHATGYTLAACAIEGWVTRLESGAGSEWKTSLAAHGELLATQPVHHQRDFAATDEQDEMPETETTDWGPAHRVRPPVTLPATRLRWDLGASDHGSTPLAGWLGG